MRTPVIGVSLLAALAPAQEAVPEKPPESKARKLRVLLIEEQPRWEYRYLHNVLKRHRRTELDSHLVSARPGTKGLRLAAGMPVTREFLRRYDVIIVGDVPRARLGADANAARGSMRLIEDFVRHGGGVVFLSGSRAMPEDYRETLFERLLPVELERERAAPIRRKGGVRAVPPEGVLHPVIRFEKTEEKTRELWAEQLEPFEHYTPVRRAKPGSTVVLVDPHARNDHGPRVVAAAGTYGKGRTFYLGSGETWRWRKRFGAKYQERFWARLVTWAAGGKTK